MTKNKPVDISIIITAHSEGILTHKTIRSVLRSISELGENYTSEIILHADNPNDKTKLYISHQRKKILKDVRIFQNSFGDLGASRNFALAKARGRYIATIDADDIMSKYWLRYSLDELEKHPYGTAVAHSEFTVEFEGANSLILKHNEIDHDTDTLLSVFANRWNSVIVAPRELLVSMNGYSTNSPGYGYEDWHLNSRLIYMGIHNILIPKTVIFVRRKLTNSEWQRQASSMAVLRKNPLLSIEHIRTVKNVFEYKEKNKLITPKNNTQLKEFIKKSPYLYRLVRKLKNLVNRGRSVAIHTNSRRKVAEWLIEEWNDLHKIEKGLFPSEQTLNDLVIYDSISDDHKKAGRLYKNIIDGLQHDSYDYLIFVPWLIKGGADLYSIHYANTINELRRDKHVLVIGTLPKESPWASRLHKDVDFVNFGSLAEDTPTAIKYRVLAHLIENANLSCIHIINSELGYDFVRTHESYLSSSGIKIIASSFSQSIDTSGRVFGYSHTHIPVIYEQSTLITSDNMAVIDMWINEYGLDSAKLLVHRQPVESSNDTDIELQKHTVKGDDELLVLWAARISPEKIPEVVRDIGSKVKSTTKIHMYGSIEDDYRELIESLADNSTVTYKGSFDGLKSIPIDDYDLLLYTSLFDGMPNTILEAANLNLPIIASAVGGIPEFIKNRETGLLVHNIHDASEYAAAIESMRDPKTRSELARNARTKLEELFNPDSYRQQVVAMLKKLNY